MNTLARAQSAIWQQSGISNHDEKGYVAQPEDNLMPGLPIAAIRQDYERGRGDEWKEKFRALHSSAALAANTFGPWKGDPSRVRGAGLTGFETLEFEAQVPTGLGGIPPHIDVLLRSTGTVVAIESKFLEPLRPEHPEFADSYAREHLPGCEDAWWALLESTRRGAPSHLNAAQLIKHYLGLRKQYAGQKCALVYLYWMPANGADFPEYAAHAGELAAFESAVAGSPGVRFLAMTYQELLDDWAQVPELAPHEAKLRVRYQLSI